MSTLHTGTNALFSFRFRIVTRTGELGFGKRTDLEPVRTFCVNRGHEIIPKGFAMTDTMTTKKPRKKKEPYPFPVELVDQLLAQVDKDRVDSWRIWPSRAAQEDAGRAHVGSRINASLGQ
jgi:hypothetical protein